MQKVEVSAGQVIWNVIWNVRGNDKCIASKETRKSILLKDGIVDCLD